jgi:hypothetical protein
MPDDLEKFIHHNRDNFDMKAPPPFVIDRIVEQLKSDDKKKPGGILIPFRVIRWAAASLILIACGVTFLIVKTKVSINAATTDDLAQNQTSKKVVMFAGLRNMESPASRISAASAAEQLQNQGNDIVDALVQTLNNDPNGNVRLASLDGLARFYRENYVRRQLIASLRKQQDPVVQIAMIHLLTRMREFGILEELDRMVNDENIQKAVKDCAYSSILELRHS